MPDSKQRNPAVELDLILQINADLIEGLPAATIEIQRWNSYAARQDSAR